MGKYLKTKEGSIESAVLEAMSPAQQAAIAISKKEKEKKEEEKLTDEELSAKQKKIDLNKNGKVDGTLEKDDKTPLGEFILSYYDRETGKFPKGETAVLTMVEKDYGEQFIEPAKAFIESIHQTFEQYQMRTQPQQLDTEEFDRMKELAGLR